MVFIFKNTENILKPELVGVLKQESVKASPMSKCLNITFQVFKVVNASSRKRILTGNKNSF